MQSRTKVEVDLGDLARATSQCLSDTVSADDFTPLTDGSYNAAYAVSRRNGAGAVVKVSPPDDVNVLTYERHLMMAEVDFYRRAQGHMQAPAVLGVDVSRQFLDRDVLVMTRLKGRPLTHARRSLSGDERAGVRRALGAEVAALRRVTGTRFGYDRPGGALSATTWSEAFALMAHTVLEDAETYSVRLPRPAAHVPELIARAAKELDAITEPVLVHFDLWDGNVFVTQGPEGARFEAVIDGERAFWGDPLAELVSTSLFKNPRRASDFNAGYATVAGTGPDFSEGGHLRLALYRAYLDLIMLTEGAPRGYRGVEHALARTLAHHDLARQVMAVRRLVG